MPVNEQIHNLIYRNLIYAQINRFGIGAWLGFNHTGGVWRFLNGDLVNLPPNFESKYLDFQYLAFY